MWRRLVFVLAALAGVLVLLGGAQVHAGTHGGGITAKPVNGKAVGHGLKLWVHVFYAKGGNPGPPPGHGGGGGSVDCTDDNQSGYATPFAQSGAITLAANQATFPSYLSGSNIQNALSSSAATWDGAVSGPNLLSVNFTGTATGPSQDGLSELGWVRIVPKNVLAATWTWTNSNNQIVEADLFFNTSWTWDTFTSCPTSPTGHFDVADIATHEMGHVLGLNHFSDTGAQATMYPSAPADETRKTTLTDGDKTALQEAIAGP
jgi:hypothetical protein